MSAKMSLEEWTDAMRRGAYVMHKGRLFRVIAYTERPTVTVQPVGLRGDPDTANLGLSFSPGTPWADYFTPVPTITEVK